MSGSGYGPTVEGGVINYLSPSGIGTADPDQPGGCFRRWYYKYVMGMQEPFTGSQALGVETHEQIERHLSTGAPGLGRLALSAKHYIPEPDPERQCVELAIPEGALTIEGIRVVGHIDLLRVPDLDGRLWSVDPVGDIVEDPIGTIEVLDWKTTSDVGKWAKQGPDLIKTIQMPLYAKFATAWPKASHVRVSHVYMQTRGSARSQKSTALLNLEQINTRWDEIRGVVRTLKTYAQSTKPEDVPANRNACSAFRGCPRADICPRSVKESIADIFGVTQSEKTKGNETMSLLDEINALTEEQAAAGNPMTAAPPPAKPKLQVPPGFAEDWAVIEAAGKGLPTVMGDAAAALAAMHGDDSAPQAFSGRGQLGTLRPLTLADVRTLADNFRGKLQASAPVTAEVGLTPPNTPAPAPAPAPVAETPEPVMDAAPEKASKPAIPSADDALTYALECRSKGKFSSIRKPDLEQAFCNLADAYDVAAAKASGDGDHDQRAAHDAYAKGLQDGESTARRELAATTPEAEAPGVTIYVNCPASNLPLIRLEAYTRSVCAALEEQTGAADIRCSDHEGLYFGKWKGAVAASVRALPLAPGVYAIDTGDEISEIVAQTLCETAKVWVRGIR